MINEIIKSIEPKMDTSIVNFESELKISVPVEPMLVWSKTS